MTVVTASRRLATPSSVNAAIKQIADVMRRANYAGALQYVPELSWILFLRILDEREEIEAEEATALGVEFVPSLEAPYRWRDWAAPEGPKRLELTWGAMGGFLGFVNEALLPHLHGLRDRPGATTRQRVVSEAVSAVKWVGVDTERNLLDILDRIHEIRVEAVDPTHVFTLSQAYEGLLLKMGEKNNDGGQFFTPREVIRAMVRLVDPRVGETALAGTRADSPRSWAITREEMQARGYDLKAVNPNARAVVDTRSPKELLDEIEVRGREVDAAITRLRALLADEAG